MMPGEHDGLARRGARDADRVQRLHAVVQVLPVARDDEQGVVDPDAQADHRRQDRGELRHARERRQDQREAGPRGEADHRRADRQAHRDDGAERDQQDDHRGQQADQLGRTRAGLRPERGVLAADLRLQVGRTDVLERRLERLERLDAQIDGRLVVGDLRVADRAVGGQGARASRTGSRPRRRAADLRSRPARRSRRRPGPRGGRWARGRPRTPRCRRQRGIARPAGRRPLRLGVRQVEVVAELAAERAADHEDRDHGGDPDAEGAPTVAGCRLAEPIEERTQGMTFRRVGGDARHRT